MAVSRARSRRSGPVRRALFWLHLSAGVVAGLVILMMSLTGVLLTYEAQIVARVEQAGYLEPSPDAVRRSLPEWIDAARRRGLEPTAVTVAAEPGAAVTLSAGRQDRLQLDPYTLEPALDAAADVRALFGAVTEWHRWFAFGAPRRDIARHVTGASNLLFLFLIVSGLVLWFPRVWAWPWLRGRLWFRRRYPSGKARDLNWHHVCGLWCALPLLAIAGSAVVFSYPWASALLYRAVGDSPPPQRPSDRQAAPAVAGADLDLLFRHAVAGAGAWRRATLSLPGPDADTVSVLVDRGNGRQPQHQVTVRLDAESGAVVEREPFAARPAGSRVRSVVRFLHTGEIFGIVGQTVAGIASLAAVVLAWSGLALAWRRLVAPLLARAAGSGVRGDARNAADR